MTVAFVLMNIFNFSLGFFTVMLAKWQLFKTITINTMTEKPLSLLVNEKYDIGVSTKYVLV